MNNLYESIPKSQVLNVISLNEFTKMAGKLSKVPGPLLLGVVMPTLGAECSSSVQMSPAV